jgi:sporulation protein YlmC with PRC-barrel domain
MMKNLMLGTAMALVLGTAASAQDLFRTEMDPIAIAASDFIGKRVYAAETAIDSDEYAGVQQGWNDIGEINDVILTRDGKIDAVLVDIGGFLGMGERQVALGMENIRFVSDSATAEDLSDFFLVVSADRTTLESAPEYMRTSAMMTSSTEVADATTADETADGARAVDGYASVESGSITLEQLMGVRVYGPNDEDVGEISDLVLDAKGTPAQVIVDVGGFLGMGEKPVAIDVTELQFLQANEGGMFRAYIRMTQDQLETLPTAKM